MQGISPCLYNNTKLEAMFQKTLISKQKCTDEEIHSATFVSQNSAFIKEKQIENQNTVYLNLKNFFIVIDVNIY